MKGIRTLPLLVILGCSGGGGSSSSIPNFEGIWDVKFEVAKNECDPTVVGDEETAAYVITQTGETLSIESEDGQMIQGRVDGDDSFLAVGTSLLGDCTVRAEVEFSALSGDTASAVVRGSLDCGQEGTCAFSSNSAVASRRAR